MIGLLWARVVQRDAARKQVKETEVERDLAVLDLHELRSFLQGEERTSPLIARGESGRNQAASAEGTCCGCNVWVFSLATGGAYSGRTGQLVSLAG